MTIRYSAVIMALCLNLISSLSAWSDGKITSLQISEGTAHLSFRTTPGCTYQIQHSTNFMSGAWTNVGDMLLATDTETTGSADESGDNNYYRILKIASFLYHGMLYQADPYLSIWGLGTQQEDYSANDRDYDWYIDQKHTGDAANNNCGPSSVTMAIKWYNESFTGTAEDARAVFPNDGGWWYTDDITSYLQMNNVPYSTKRCNGPDHIESIIKEGKIIIICYDTSRISSNSNTEERYERFYGYRGGHFAVIKGVRTVSGTRYFETYDPNNWDAEYNDGTPKGRNRHYTDTQLDNAIARWWDYLIVIDPPAAAATQATATLNALEIDPYTVDEATIPVGRSGAL